MDSAAVAHGEMPRRLFPGIEMLVKPVTGRAVNARLPPFDLDHLVLVSVRVRTNAPLLVPEEYVADRLRADDDRPGPVIVRLMIFSHRPFAQMADQCVARQFELRQAQTGSFHFQTFEHGGFDIGYEVGLPDIDQAAHITLLADFEVILLTVIAVFEAIRTIENKTFVAINVEGERRIGYREIAHRFTRTVE